VKRKITTKLIRRPN